MGYVVRHSTESNQISQILLNPIGECGALTSFLINARAGESNIRALKYPAEYCGRSDAPEEISEGFGLV
jgi:hypothetical protein